MPSKKKRALRVIAIQLLSVVVVAFVAFGMLHRGAGGGDAVAAPHSARTSAVATDTQAPSPASDPPPIAPAASVSVPNTTAGDAGSGDPIDLAVAPDGGVPSQPSGTVYRSPFAKPNPGAPVRAKVAMLLNSIDDYDVKSGTFTADFFLSLTSAQPMPPMNLQFPNGKLDNKEILADKPTFRLYRMTGSFKSPPNLRNYPFDAQELRIVIEDDLRGIDQIRFTADKERTQLARGFRVLGWQVDYVEARSLSQAYPDRFEGDDLYYGRYIFTLGIERFATSAAFKVFVPAFVIVIISLLGMWVGHEHMEVRSNSGAPMLAGAVLFHFALMQELPPTSYFTRADKVMLGVYFSLLLGMISTWWMFLVKEENIPIVFRVGRAVVPIISLAAMVIACFV
ncbi:MAG: hypothetical protein FWD73_02735 [Polyangiaceae bacterium]|nr:hypothetical protein [Polyangiaceae bacterium]